MAKYIIIAIFLALVIYILFIKSESDRRRSKLSHTERALEREKRRSTDYERSLYGVLTERDLLKAELAETKTALEKTENERQRLWDSNSKLSLALQTAGTEGGNANITNQKTVV